MKTVCPFCGAYRYDSQQMSGISTHTHTKYIIPKTGAECNSPAPKKKKKAPGPPRVLAPSQTPRTQNVRYFRPNLPSARRADRPAAAGRIKFPIKVQLCRTFIPLPRDTCPEPPLPCRGEGGIVFGFSGTENVSRGDSVPPGITQPSHTSSCSPLRGRASSILMPSFADRPPYSTPYIASVIGMETPCCCARW